MKDPKPYNWYKLTYERAIKRFPNHVIMKKNDGMEWQWISNKIKRILYQFRENVDGAGKIKILNVNPSMKISSIDDTVLLFFDITMRFRLKNKLIKNNIHNTVVCIKTDYNTMQIDIDILEQEMRELIGFTPVDIRPSNFYSKYIKISDLN